MTQLKKKKTDGYAWVSFLTYNDDLFIKKDTNYVFMLEFDNSNAPETIAACYDGIDHYNGHYMYWDGNVLHSTIDMPFELFVMPFMGTFPIIVNQQISALFYFELTFTLFWETTIITQTNDIQYKLTLIAEELAATTRVTLATYLRQKGLLILNLDLNYVFLVI